MWDCSCVFYHLEKEHQEVLTRVCVGFGGGSCYRGVRQLRAPQVPKDSCPESSRWDRGSARRVQRSFLQPWALGRAARSPEGAQGRLQERPHPKQLLREVPHHGSSPRCGEATQDTRKDSLPS